MGEAVKNGDKRIACEKARSLPKNNTDDSDLCHNILLDRSPSNPMLHLDRRILNLRWFRRTDDHGRIHKLDLEGLLCKDQEIMRVIIALTGYVPSRLFLVHREVVAQAQVICGRGALDSIKILHTKYTIGDMLWGLPSEAECMLV